MTERSEQDRTRDIFAHIREILERDGDKAEILFNAIQLRMLLTCETVTTIITPSRMERVGDTMTAAEFGFKACERGDNLETMLADITAEMKL